MDYPNLQSTADRLISQNGRVMIIRKRSGGAFNPVTGSYSTGAVIDFLVNAIDYIPPYRNWGRGKQVGTDVGTEQRMVLISASSVTFDLSTEDRLLVDDTEYSIQYINKMNPGGTVLYYLLTLGM